MVDPADIRGNDEGWGSPLIVSCLGVSALLLVLFAMAERRAADPLLDLPLFRKPGPASQRRGPQPRLHHVRRPPDEQAAPLLCAGLTG